MIIFMAWTLRPHGILVSTRVCRSACKVKIIRLKIWASSNLNYGKILTPHRFTPCSFSSLVKSLNLNLAHMSNTPNLCGPNGQIRKEITRFVRHSQCIRDFFNPSGQIRIRDWTWSQLSAHTRHKWMTCANSRPDPILILMARLWAGKSQFIIHYQFQFCLWVSEAVSDFNVLH